MGGAIGEMLPLAIGIAISPLAIVAVILILTTPRARTNGPAFLGGWLLALAVVGGVALAATDAAESADSSGPRTIVALVKIALGLVLFFLAWRGFRSRPKPGEEAPLPKWMAALDRFTPGRSLAVGALFGGVKPKNLILAAAAAAGIAGSGLGGAQQVVVLLLLILVASVGDHRPGRRLLPPGRGEGGAGPRRLEDVAAGQQLHGDDRAVRRLRRGAARQGDRRALSRGAAGMTLRGAAARSSGTPRVTVQPTL